MTVAVELDDLRRRIDEFGDVALIVTVGADYRPHVVSTRILFDGSRLRAAVGNTTGANATDREAVTLVWPAAEHGDYCLIVDGRGVVEAASGNRQLVVSPLRGVLHRVAGAPESQPSCVTVLDHRDGTASGAADEG